MGCVNKSSKEFRKLASDHNLDENALELIIHNYWLERGSEDLFPTAPYIQAKLGFTQYVEPMPTIRAFWEAAYNKPKTFDSESEYKQAWVQAITYFPKEAIFHNKDAKGKDVLVIRRPVESLKQDDEGRVLIYDKQGEPIKPTTEQEDRDYRFISNQILPSDKRIPIVTPAKEPTVKRPDKKERQSVGNQPFTFNDDIVVTVPFRPNEQQADALNQMNDFIHSQETTMTLAGYAGTGKTSLMEIIAQKMRREHKPVVFSATTNKAAAVLKSRVSKAGFDAQTLNKVFGINVEVDSTKAYNARNLVTALREADIMPGTTVIIDEASMINEENYNILNRVARENGLKIIYVGDKAQLAPVNETQVSKVFRNTEGRVVELTQVERTDDNAILKEATNIRNGLPLSGESSFNERGEGVGYLTPKSRDEIGKVIRHYIQGLKDNPNFFRILAWQNKTVTAYNDYVRTLFGYTDYIPHVEEPLTGYANWGWNDRTRGYRFINSEAYKVTKVGSPQKTSISIDGKTYEMEYVPVTAENSMGEIDTYNYMDIRGNQENLRVAKILAQKKTELWDKWRHTVGREAKTNIRLQINAIDQFLFVNDKIEDTSRTLPDGSHPLLQQKVVDFGYALTVHKSQGSTFTHVMMDEMDIAKSEKNNAANSQELYKGEDRWVAPEDQQTSISDEINLGIDEYETKPQTTPNASATATNPNAANVRHQLEYVAVSRATNTVTILSNNVKKEGSPLGTQQTQVPQTQPQIEKVELPKGFKESTSREGAIHLEIGGKYGYPEYVNAMQRHLLVGDVYVSYNSQTGKYIIERGDRNGNYKTKELDSLTDEWIAAEAFKPQIARALEKYFKISAVANNETDSSQSQNQQQSTPSSYEGLVTPETNTIFVFGSNPEGRHGAGAAKTAKDKFGAIYGQGEGLQGQSYALPTKRIEKSLPTSRPAKVRLDVLLAEKLLNGQEIQEIVVAPYHTKNKQEDFKDLKKGEILNVEETNGYSNNRTKRNLQVRVKEVSNDNGIVKATFELASANGERTIPESQIIESIKKLYEVARQNPNKQFKIGYTNELHEYTLNGYQGSEMIRMFKDAGSIPSNIVFSKNWTDNWNKVASKNLSSDKADNSYEVKGSNSIEVKGENITSKGSEFAKKLTNPGNDLQVVYKGRTFRNAEHAYQTWKSGEFDEVAYKSDAFKPRGSKPVNKQTNYQTMVEIITAKLQQHPKLVQGITERGGEAYLKASTHDMIGDKYWETKTGQNKFIEALTDAYKTIISENIRFNKEADLIAATIAPYFKTSYEDYVAMTPEKQKEMREAFAKAAHEVANALGIPLDMKQASFNIGGYEFNNGTESIVEPSFTFRLDTTPEKAKLFAALMGDLGYEQQETVISQYEVGSYDDGNCVRHSIVFSDANKILKELETFGIKNFTYDKTNGVLSILSFDEKDVQKYIELRKKLNTEGYELKPEETPIQSDLLEPADREALYREWLTAPSEENKQGEQSPELLSFIQKALEKLENSTLPIDEGTPTEQPQQVSLPSYEYFMDRYEDTTVDAAWKIPLLKQLDEQLTEAMSNQEEGTFEASQEIAEKMDRILNAKGQEDMLDLQTPEPTKEKKTVEQNLTEFEKMTQQINNLLDSNIISASEIRHVAELVVNSISDTITILQKEDGAAEKFFPNIETKIDFKTASRKDIVEAIGINNLIHRAKQQFDPEQNDYEDFDTIDQADLIIDNWDAIMTLAADTFAMTEGFGIMRNYDNGGFNTTQAPTIDYDNFNDYSNDSDAMAESEKDEQEHWQVEQRTIDVLNSMSQLVRLALHDCYQTNPDGSKVMSKWGIAERVNPRQAVNSILRWTQGALTLEDMVKKMTNKSAQNPWLNQLVERLLDKSGKEADFQSQFFGVFSKHFQPYSVVLLEDGKYHSIPVNSHPALSEAMQTITTQFKIGEHPLFTDRGINVKLLGTERTTYPEADFNLHKALSNLQIIQDKLSHGEQFSNSIAKDATANIMGVCRVMGYPVTEEMLRDVINPDNLKYMTDKLYHMIKSLDGALDAQRREPNKQYNPFAFGTDNNIGGTLRNFLTPITDTLEDTAISAFYDSGKMYQSYVTPSFMSKLMNKFRLEGQEFEDFIMSEYGSSEWFKSGKNQWDISRGWRNVWLNLLATDENAHKVFDHKVELNFNKHNYMRNMSDAEYTLSLITEYFAETPQKGQTMVPAWFRIPIMSNKPSSEFIKFYSYRGANYKSEIIYGLHQMFNQELSRIQTVNMRNHSKGDSQFIQNFDSNGKKFNFLPFLNKYLDANETSHFGLLLKKKLNGLDKLDAQEEAQLATIVDNIIRQNMEDRVAKILNEWENSGILEAAENIDGVGEKEQIRANLENFLWNDNFASKNILQLTVTDIAFYKDAEDLQKRLAQIHAPGIRGNVAATDYEGNPVTDGKYRTILIQGLQKFKTDLIANLIEVFDRKIAAAPESQKAQWRALKEDLVGDNGRYTKIDVTDGQGYSSPSSYRKKAFIFGRWSHHAEDIYQRLKKGDYNYSDLEVAFQPLKPFVYTHLQKDLGVDNAPIHQMPVPFQAKNSEYLLIMADALLQGEKTSKPNLLKAIYRVMEDSERLNPTKGIDTVQFDSAIKSGLQAPIDLNPFVDMVGGEEAAYIMMMKSIYQNWDSNMQEGTVLNYSTDTYVHEGEYEDYCLQQEVPEHFKNHSQAHGSQIRMIIPSDLDLYKNPNGDRTAEDNQVYYEWTEPDGTKKKLKADEFRKEYEQTIADNIRESIDQLSQELHINSNDKKERNIALSKILQREILSSPRYGIDLIQACSIDKETGEFRIPKGDPIQAKRIEQLINSIIKNRVNKQKIAGGPIVQVTNFGTSRQLHIKFNDRNGGLLMTREEYEQNPQKKGMSQTDKFNARYGKKTALGNMTYEEYVKQNQAGIAYFEVFAPIWSNELFEKFANEDGSINIDAIEATDPELLKMVSYRIPTEDKYSCAPMKVVGFMPREAGDAIMFPYELTEIDDSDFDVDKRYTMRKDIPIKRKAKHIIRKELFDIVADSYQKQYNKELPANISNEIEMFLDSPDTMRNKNSFNQWMYSQYQRIAYTTEAPTSGRTYRDNKIVDMTWAVLTNEMTADKILNPGGFDVFKRNGYMVAAYKNPANNYSWEQLQQMSIDELNKLSYTEKDLTWLDTQIQFYKQNAAAASLIGVFAVNKVAHATLESNNYYVAADEICGNDYFTIANTEFGGRMKVDPTYDQEGNLIGKTIGAGVSASADAAKTPVLNLMNINMTTAGIFNTLLRLGMAPNDASLFMSQDIIERVLNEFNRENLTNYKPLSTIIEEHLSELREKHDISDDSNINSEALSKDELVNGLLPVTPMNQDSHEVIDYKVLLAFQKVRALVDAMRKPTFATRFNSVSSAVGPLIIDNLIIEHKIEQFTDAASEDGTHFYDSDGNPVDIDDIFYDHPVLKEFSRTVDIAKLMFYDMPAGSTGFRNLLATLPEGLIDKVYNDKKLLDNLSNFYQSYLLVASQMVNPANLKNYIEGFPKYFNEQNFKEKYPDNALIQAIRMNVTKRTGRPFLSINITGIDEAQKEVYRSAWIDLHKDNPELSKKLFEYCFFRAGIGFSPKTFMSLVPAYVKERLATDLGNGNQSTYVDTYRMFPNVNPELVIDQWVRNNWDNNKLVPKRGGEETHYIVDLKRGSLVARDPRDIADLQGNKYIKTRHNGQTYLWKQIIADKTAVNYVMVKPLGNNGEYMEMSLGDITKPLSDTKETIEDMQESELQATSPAEADAAQESSADIVTDGEKAKQTAELAELVMKQNPKFNKTQALNQIERMKEKPDMYAGFLVNVFKQKGLNLTKEEALKEFKKLC